LLGVVKGILPQKLASKVELNSVIKQNTGKFRQPYPPYSSKPVHGKPLFVWAKEGKLKQIQIPTKNIEIHAIKLLDIRSLPATKLKEQVPQIIHRVTGDFRQTLINQSWEKSLKPHLKAQFPLLTLKVSCTTGTYMRSLANKIGKQLKTPALAYKITRTEIGSNKLKPKDYPKAK
jgi:tRNA U55 pseudouridine synthase TruB